MKLNSTLLSAKTVVLGIVVGAAVAAAGAAVASRDTATPFRIVLTAHHVEVAPSERFPIGITHVGTFTSASPFCDSGTAADVDSGTASGSLTRRFTCDDGSGSLTFSISPAEEAQHVGSGSWRIMDGTGSYGGLNGKGTFRGETLSGDLANKNIVFRVTAEGFVGSDSVVPTLAISSAAATKLRKPTGAYSIRVALALRDDVADNAVSYTVDVFSGRKLATTSGMSSTGTATATLRVQRPNQRVRSVQLQVTASDPVGNETKLTRTVVLPR